MTKVSGASSGVDLLTAVGLEAKEPTNQGALQRRERAMAIFEGPDRNRNIIIIVVVVVVVAIIYYLYTTGRLPGI